MGVSNFVSKSWEHHPPSRLQFSSFSSSHSLEARDDVAFDSSRSGSGVNDEIEMSGSQNSFVSLNVYQDLEVHEEISSIGIHSWTLQGVPNG